MNGSSCVQAVRRPSSAAMPNSSFERTRNGMAPRTAQLER
jgi:hypothetical protein